MSKSHFPWELFIIVPAFLAVAVGVHLDIEQVYPFADYIGRFVVQFAKAAGYNPPPAREVGTLVFAVMGGVGLIPLVKNVLRLIPP